LKASNAGHQLRRAIGIQAEGKKLLENDAIAPSAARLCWVAPYLMTRTKQRVNADVRVNEPRSGGRK